MGVRVLQYSDLENAYDRPDRIGRVAGIIRSLRDTTTLVVGTGDNTAPGVLSMHTDGRHALDFFEAVQPDLETPGNHDFDYGPDALGETIAASPQTWIGTNLTLDPQDAQSHALTNATTGGGIEQTALREVAGTRLGFVGLIDPATPGDTPTAEGLRVADPIASAREALSALHARGVDHGIALAHLGTDLDRLARETELDAILAGHVHAPRIDRIEGTVIARPGANGADVIALELEEGRWTAVRHDVDEGPMDRSVADAFETRLAETSLGETIATPATPIPRDDEAVYAGPTRVGTAIAESYRWWTDADVGLQNSGGIRSGPSLSGPVSAADIVSLVPFREPVAVFELTGSGLASILDERDGAVIEGAPADRYMGHVSGVETHDGTHQIEGAAIDPDRTYRLATSEYLRHAESEFPTLTGLEPERVSDVPQYEVLLAFVRQQGFPKSTAVPGRSRDVAND